jgi:hypothetical protein
MLNTSQNLAHPPAPLYLLPPAKSDFYYISLDMIIKRKSDCLSEKRFGDGFELAVVSFRSVANIPARR